MTLEKKYLVFKSDFKTWLDALKEDEYFVLRNTDVLGIATLRSYVSNVLLLLDLDDSFTDDQQEYLRALADGVAALADQWEKIGRGARKVPD